MYDLYRNLIITHCSDIIKRIYGHSPWHITPHLYIDSTIIDCSFISAPPPALAQHAEEGNLNAITVSPCVALLVMLILSKYSSENEGFRTEGRDLFINDITGDLQCMDYSSCRGRKIEIYDPLTNTAYYVMAQIETDQVVMMVDSGCTLSIMSKKVLKKIPPTSYTKPVKVVGSGILADGSRAPLSGSTLLSFDLAQRSFRHRFLIGDMANHTLLGLDFMEENQCTLDFNDGTLRFGDEVVSCCTVDGDPLKPNFYSDNDMTPDLIHHKASNPHRCSIKVSETIGIETSPHFIHILS